MANRFSNQFSNTEYRRRKLRVQLAELKREQLVYEKQKKLLPLIILCGLLFIAFWLAPKFLSKHGPIIKLTETKGEIPLEIKHPGIYVFNQSFNFKGVKSANHLIKIEYFIKQNGEKLYHFYNALDSGILIDAAFKYKFRNAGKYTISSRTTLVNIKDGELTPINTTIKETSGQFGYIKAFKYVFLIAGLMMFFLQDYFGRNTNYKRIWNNKEMIINSKGFFITLTLGVLIFAGGIYTSQTGYGYAGYDNDMHEPAQKLKQQDIYYIN